MKQINGLLTSFAGLLGKSRRLNFRKVPEGELDGRLVDRLLPEPEQPKPDMVRIYDLPEAKKVLRDVDSLYAGMTTEDAVRMHFNKGGKGIKFYISLYQNDGTIKDVETVPAGGLEHNLILSQEHVATFLGRDKLNEEYEPKFVAVSYEESKMISLRIFYAPKKVTVDEVMKPAGFGSLDSKQNRFNPDYSPGYLRSRPLFRLKPAV